MDRLGNYFLGLHSGRDIHMSEFASAVQNCLEHAEGPLGPPRRHRQMLFHAVQDQARSGTGSGGVILLLLQLWGSESDAQDM